MMHAIVEISVSATSPKHRPLSPGHSYKLLITYLFLLIPVGSHVYFWTFFLGRPRTPNSQSDTPIGEAVQPNEGQSTRSLSMPLDRGCATNASLLGLRFEPLTPYLCMISYTGRGSFSPLIHIRWVF